MNIIDIFTSWENLNKTVDLRKQSVAVFLRRDVKYSAYKSQVSKYVVTGYAIPTPEYKGLGNVLAQTK